MKTNDFSNYLTKFFVHYLPVRRKLSERTIESYRDTFLLLLRYLEEKKGVKSGRVTMKTVTKPLIEDFLLWLEAKGNGDSTINNRLAAITTFFKFVKGETLDFFSEGELISTIPYKRIQRPVVNYLTVEEMSLFLQQPDRSKVEGRRDLILLSILYDSAARVNELINLTPSQLRLNGKDPSIEILGKGNKGRLVPLMNSQVKYLQEYLKENNLIEGLANQQPMFFSSQSRKPLTRPGIQYKIDKYCELAREKDKNFTTKRITCHGFRHSRAIHWLQAGMPEPYITHMLGHEDPKTTHRYTQIDNKYKRLALEKANKNIASGEVEIPQWEKDPDLIAMLRNLSRKL